MLRIIRKPKYLPGGAIQDVTQEAEVTSIPSSYDLYMQGINMQREAQFNNQATQDAMLTPSGINTPISNSVAPDLGAINAEMGSYADELAKEDEKNFMRFQRKKQNMEFYKEEKPSQDKNPLAPMQAPYYSPDLLGRANMLGTAIGNIRAGNRTGANIAMGAASAASLGMGLTREIMGANSAAYAAARDEKAAREKLERERRNQFIKYNRDGGVVYSGGGDIKTSDMTGEYIYPLPKSMEDNANVEIEGGEYVITPDITAPMEAKGKKHRDGGMPMELEEAYIVSDYRKIPDEFASEIRESYGVKVTPKDTYATVLDKYKKKIGLEEKYADQERVIKRLEKNKDVKDKNTSDLNASILSKYVNDNQTDIDKMESDFRKFAEYVYTQQELDKRAEAMDTFFKEGGKVDINKVRKQAKALGIDEQQAKDWIYDEYVKRMEVGGPTKEDEERAKALWKVLNSQFGRQLLMSEHDVADYGSIINEGSELDSQQELQHRSKFGYGRVNEKAVDNLLDVNRWARGNREGNELKDVAGFQSSYNQRMNDLWSLANVGAISNADDAKKFRDQKGFWGQSMLAQAEKEGKRYDGDKYNTETVDDKFGQTTATRSFYGLDVVTPEQLKALNEKDIKNYVDLFGDKAAEAKKILGDDYKKFEAINADKSAEGLDFVLDAYHAPIKKKESEPAPVINEIPFEDEDVPLYMPELVDTSTLPKTPKADKVDVPKQSSPAGFNAVFPEVFRMVDSGLTLEGLERHQAPRVDPVLQSADQYINELNRATSAQLDAIGDVPDSQRAAILSNMNAIAGTNIGKYINEVNLQNARQINGANRFNEMAYVQTDDKNIAERQRYEASALKAMAIRDENLARYYDSINSEIQNKFNVQTSLNAISSVAPNMRMLPNGQVVYTQGNEDVIYGGDYSTGILSKMDEEIDKKKKKG